MLCSICIFLTNEWDFKYELFFWMSFVSQQIIRKLYLLQFNTFTISQEIVEGFVQTVETNSPLYLTRAISLMKM